MSLIYEPTEIEVSLLMRLRDKRAEVISAAAYLEEVKHRISGRTGVAGSLVDQILASTQKEFAFAIHEQRNLVDDLKVLLFSGLNDNELMKEGNDALSENQRLGELVRLKRLILLLRLVCSARVVNNILLTVSIGLHKYSLLIGWVTVV